jgi:hypothetical protein
MKYCMDCRFFLGKLGRGDREFLVKLLKQHDAKLMLKSWVRMGQVKKPSGHGVDSDKARAVDILRHKGFCRKERVHVSALDVGCIFCTEKE